MPSRKRALLTFGGVVSALMLLAALAGGAAGAGGPRDGRQEDPSLRTAHSATAVDARGRHEARVYGGPVRFRDGSGQWKAIDNTLVPTDGGAVTNAANSYRASLPEDASAPVTFSTARGSVSVSLEGARSHRTVDGSHASYPSALAGVDVTYAVGNAGVKETLTLASSDVPRTFSYSLAISSGLTSRINASGGVDFVDSSGSRAFSFAPPSMVDAAGVASTRIRFHLSHGGTQLTLTADGAWLSDANRAWPVVVDPSFVANGADRECFLRDGADAATSFCGGASVDVGSDGAETSRTLLTWDLSFLPQNTIVQSATLGLYVEGESTSAPLAVAVHRATTPWSAVTTWNEADSGVPWQTAGGDFVAAPEATTTVGGATGVTANWDVTNLVQGWVDGSVVNDGMLLDATGGPNVVQFATTIAPQTSQMPFLDVTYDTAPQTTITSGPSNSTSTSATFRFASDVYGSTFECSLDSAPFAACSTPQSYTGLAVGSHAFAVRATSPGATVDASPATRAWTIDAAPQNLLANGSFEGSLSGWSGVSSTVALVGDGKVGPGAARVARTTGSSFSIVTAARPVGTTAAGAVYTAGGWSRSDTPGHTQCLIVRESTSAGALVSSRSSCVTSSRNWLQFGADRYVAARNGDVLDVLVTQSGAVAGNSFEVDGLSLIPG